MKLTTIGGALLAVLVITGSAAALPAAAGAQADDTDATEANETAHGPPADAGPPADVGPSGEAGPPADLPGQVPAFVGEIHDLIHQYQDGTLDGNLGEQISAVTPDDESDDESAENESAEDEMDTESDEEEVDDDSDEEESDEDETDDETDEEETADDETDDEDETEQ